MEILTTAIIERLESQNYNQAKLCKELNINRHSFNRAVKSGKMGLETIAKIYEYLGEDFSLIEELKPIVERRMKKYTYTELPTVIGLSYSSARNFVNKGVGNRNVLEALYYNDKECQDLILKYCL